MIITTRIPFGVPSNSGIVYQKKDFVNVKLRYDQSAIYGEFNIRKYSDIKFKDIVCAVNGVSWYYDRGARTNRTEPAGIEITVDILNTSGGKRLRAHFRCNKDRPNFKPHLCPRGSCITNRDGTIEEYRLIAFDIECLEIGLINDYVIKLPGSKVIDTEYKKKLKSVPPGQFTTAGIAMHKLELQKLVDSRNEIYFIDL